MFLPSFTDIRACVLLIVALGVTGSCASHAPENAAETPRRPNILVIVADDLGYSDIGAFGGEISTPNLDKLAENGVRLTHFHTSPACSPTRSMLLSGTDSHTAGVGAMAEFIPPQYRGREGFEGVLTTRVATLAERLSAVGYRTAMAGKWHLGGKDGERPAQRGFQTSYALLQGAADHFGSGGFGASDSEFTRADYLENDAAIKPSAGFYSSDAFTDKLVEQLGRGDSSKPFFAYLAFTAPHAPLQAPSADIEKYLHRYDGGWATLARDRIARMKALGVLPGRTDIKAEQFGPSQESWDSLSAEEKQRQSKRMAIYAAMIERMDRNIGRLLESLAASGALDDTIILFISDNGPPGEDPRTYAMMPGFKKRFEAADASLAGMGGPKSFVLQDPRWAVAISAPSRLYKSFITEGGTLAPAIISGKALPKGSLNAVFGDAKDVLPTLFALADVPVTGVVDGRSVAPVEGVDLSPWLSNGTSDRPAAPVALEFYGQASVWDGKWKAVKMPAPMSDGVWRLYDLENDPGEKTDLRAKEPGKFDELMKAWSAYAARHQLIETNTGQKP